MAGVFHVASSVMRGLVPGIHVFLLFAEAKNDVDDSDARAFTPVFGELCPAMTNDCSGHSGKI
jgi:hypothetical protein